MFIIAENLKTLNTNSKFHFTFTLLLCKRMCLKDIFVNLMSARETYKLWSSPKRNMHSSRTVCARESVSHFLFYSLICEPSPFSVFSFSNYIPTFRATKRDPKFLFYGWESQHVQPYRRLLSISFAVNLYL